MRWKKLFVAGHSSPVSVSRKLCSKSFCLALSLVGVSTRMRATRSPRPRPFNTLMPVRQVSDFNTDVQLKPVRTYVSLLALWKALGVEFLVNLDQKAPSLRFLRKFWEQYLSYILRGKELRFEFEVVKDSDDAE